MSLKSENRSMLTVDHICGVSLSFSYLNLNMHLIYNPNTVEYTTVWGGGGVIYPITINPMG